MSHERREDRANCLFHPSTRKRYDDITSTGVFLAVNSTDLHRREMTREM